MREAVRVGEMRIRHAEARGLIIHLRDEMVDGASGGLSEGDGGSVV